MVSTGSRVFRSVICNLETQVYDGVGSMRNETNSRCRPSTRRRVKNEGLRWTDK